MFGFGRQIVLHRHLVQGGSGDGQVVSRGISRIVDLVMNQIQSLFVWCQRQSVGFSCPVQLDSSPNIWGSDQGTKACYIKPIWSRWGPSACERAKVGPPGEPQTFTYQGIVAAKDGQLAFAALLFVRPAHDDDRKARRFARAFCLVE